MMNEDLFPFGHDLPIHPYEAGDRVQLVSHHIDNGTPSIGCPATGVVVTSAYENDGEILVGVQYDNDFEGGGTTYEYACLLQYDNFFQ
jgi:hypothetical protein